MLGLMHKVVTFATADLAFDPKGVAEAVNKACRGRSGRYWLRGVCQVEDTTFFVLLPDAGRSCDEGVD